MTVAEPTAMAGADVDAGPALEVRQLRAGFGSLTVLWDIDLVVRRGRAVALLGANGAGKTTLLKAAAGLLSPTAGSVHIMGADVTDKSAHRRAQRGLCLIPEGRGIFPSLTVRDNLRLQVSRKDRADGYAPALEIFPVLKDRLGQTAGTMSGGQQQMLALARCYLAHPSVVLLDEVSMGLAPLIVDQIFESLAELARTGVALLLVEQYVARALEIVDDVYLLSHGNVVYSGAAAGLDEGSVLDHYLGASGNRPRADPGGPERNPDPSAT